MGHDFWLTMGCLGGAFLLYTWLVIHNYREMIKSKPERLAARRAYKRKKNMALAKFYGIDYKPKDDDKD
jgi:hypothetical protein